VDVGVGVPGGSVVGVGVGAEAAPASADREAPQPAAPAPTPTEQAAAAGAAVTLVTFQAVGLEGVRALAARPGGFLRRTAAHALRWSPALLLFSRIEKGEVLENEVRARVHDVIQQEPGVSLEQVRERAGVAWGTTVHHVRRLESHGLVVSVRQGNRRLLFPANTPASRNRTALAALADDTSRRVALLVYSRPGIAQKDLCEALGMRNPAASKQLAKLAHAGLVHVTPDGRRRLYHPTDALHEGLGALPATVTMASIEVPQSGPQAPQAAQPAATAAATA
ncbi:MAG TPA: MarR family transcriptional regulator, partial [Candidatus Thermoplasmatota archaeon]|nr:MarR family transcriptional regulator [Candidatus Thermoplasmatota archaeon]